MGIDPGLTGALSIYTPRTHELEVIDMPILKLIRNGRTKSELDVVQLASWFECCGAIEHVYIERVGAMPAQGVSSTFAFGKAFGIALGLIAGRFMPFTLVSAAVWKKELLIPASKDGARARASQLLPRHAANWTRVKDHGRAESALIAYYCARKNMVNLS